MFTSPEDTVQQKGPAEAFPIDPYQLAIPALQKLLGPGWIESGHIGPFYVELSGIVRAYLENRYELHAPEQTTEEFIREAGASGLLSPEHRRLVIDFLTQCDLVKFARAEPSSSDMHEAFNAAERLVRETRPPAEAPE